MPNVPDSPAGGGTCRKPSVYGYFEGKKAMNSVGEGHFTAAMQKIQRLDDSNLWNGGIAEESSYL